VAILWHDGKRHDLSDLAQEGVRFVALPNPKLAPYGVAAQQALEHAGLWEKVKGKVVYGENVRQTLQLFDSGNADAVLTAASLVEDRKPELVPSAWHQPIVQKVGIVAASQQQAAARQFLEFLASPAGKAIFAQFGFGTPTP
jgi:molybdate transport system substrate-binding protein